MLNLNMDVTQLLDQGAFQRFYAFKDKDRDEELAVIRSKENKWQGLGVASAIPFGYLSVRNKDIKYFLPGLILIGGCKYYSGQVRQRLLQEAPGLNDYWRKSRKLEFDLRKTETYIEQRKLLEKV